MTREILFRGKREDTGEWIEGYFLQLHRSERAFIVPKQFVQRGTLRMSGETPPKIIPIEVIPETVSQFTGLTDKNSKKIFKGDIIAKGFELYEVRWNPEQVRWGIYLGNYEVAGFTKFSESYFEVAGNIYDNKELLNGKDRG